MSDLEKFLKSDCGKAKLASMPIDERKTFMTNIKDLAEAGYVNFKKPMEWAPASKFFDVLFEKHMHAMLNSIMTQVGSITGNVAMTSVMSMEKVMAVGISKGIYGKDSASWREAWASTVGTLNAAAKSKQYVDATIKHLSNQTYGEASEATLSDLGLPQALGQNTKLFEINAAITPENLGMTKDKGWRSKDGWLAAGIELYGQYHRLAGQTLTIGDQYFKMVNYLRVIEEESVRQAMLDWHEYKQANPDASFDKSNYLARVEEYKMFAEENPKDPMVLKAVRAAEESTFVNRMHSDIGRSVAENNVVGVRWIIPIRKVPMNIVARGFERSPLALLDPRIIRELASDDPAVSSMAISRMSLGTTVMLLTMGLLKDNLVGERPEGKQAQELWYIDGFKEDSFVFRGETLGKPWVVAMPFKYFGPYERPLRALARMNQVMNKRAYIQMHGDSMLDKSEEVDSLYMDITMSLAQSFMGDLWMDEMKSFFDTIGAITGHGDNKRALRAAGRMASMQMVSNATYQLATKKFDPIKREADSMWDDILRRIPILSKSLPPAISFWGETIPWASDTNPDYVDGLDLYGGGTKKVGMDKVVRELRRIRFNIPEMTRDHLNVKMTDEEFTYFKVQSGQGLHKKIETRMLMPDWDKNAAKGRNVFIMPTDHARRAEITAIVDRSRENAVNALRMNPEFDFNKRVMQYQKDNAKAHTKQLARDVQ